MRQRAVGSLVVVNSANQPVGVVTDRGLMTRVLSAAVNHAGKLVSILTLEDIWVMLADQFAQVGEVLAHQTPSRDRHSPIGRAF
jgi:predicted transcriptional regulator